MLTMLTVTMLIPLSISFVRHAMAFLHPQRVAILPHWHRDFEEWHKAKEREQRNIKKTSYQASEED